MKTTRIRMAVSIAGTVAGRDFSAQPGDVVDVEARQAAKWVAGGHAAAVPPSTPLTSRDLSLADLDAEELLHYRCAWCPDSRAQRAEGVYKNLPLCREHFRAAMEG